MSQIMPVIHPYVVAATGDAHGNDYMVQDYGLAVLTAAKAMAMTVIDLLAGGAHRAAQVKAGYKPRMTKQEYLSLMEGMLKDRTFSE